QRYDTNTIGIEISVPLYAGGGVSASVRQASSNLAQVEYELEGKTRETLIELRRQFNACQSGVSKLRAYQKALISAEALVVSTRQSILGGERVNLDALNAEQQLYSTRRDLAQTRYDYLLAWTKLHFYAGTLGAQDLARVDEAFIAPGQAY
ncbi:TolC family protein, partial [Pseudomonas fluorescens]